VKTRIVEEAAAISYSAGSDDVINKASNSLAGDLAPIDLALNKATDRSYLALAPIEQLTGINPCNQTNSLGSYLACRSASARLLPGDHVPIRSCRCAAPRDRGDGPWRSIYPAACGDKKEASRDDRETCSGRKRGARATRENEECGNPSRVGEAWRRRRKKRDGNPDGKTSPRAYMHLNTEGWQVAIDAKLFYQSVGGYFSLFC
jgi:hypothetical protein